MRCYEASQTSDDGALACEAPRMLEAADSLAAFVWARLGECALVQSVTSQVSTETRHVMEIR